jgi:hypothetical protein
MILCLPSGVPPYAAGRPLPRIYEMFASYTVGFAVPLQQSVWLLLQLFPKKNSPSGIASF